MRYAVMGTTVEKVRDVGGSDVKEAPRAGIIFATLTREQVDRLRALGCQVSEVGKVKAPVMPPRPIEAFPTYTPYQFSVALGYEDLRTITTPPVFGSGYNLAIIDTGIRESHEHVKGRVVYSKNFTASPMRDGFSHGTAVASIALVAAPQCNILNLKVLDDKGVGSEEEVALAIDDCIRLHDTQSAMAPSIINLSLGSPDDGNPYNPIRLACRAAIDRDIWVFAAAGNDSLPGTIMSPACERYVVAIGSMSYDPFIVSTFSSRGPTKEGLIKPEMVLFGQDLAVAGSGSDTEIVGKSGTSFSTPVASGMAVLLREAIDRAAARAFPGYPEPGEALGLSWQTLIDDYMPRVCLKPQGVPAGKDNDYGWGLPFGAFIRQVLSPAGIAGIDLTAILSPLSTILVMGFLGIIIGTISDVVK
ncbi:MAG: S8 family serine peptidase [Desulfobacterales bacterium]|nr:S8 family serine peptidase [Desulfobacterales bacterium]